MCYHSNRVYTKLELTESPPCLKASWWLSFWIQHTLFIVPWKVTCGIATSLWSIFPSAPSCTFRLVPSAMLRACLCISPFLYLGHSILYHSAYSLPFVLSSRIILGGVSSDLNISAPTLTFHSFTASLPHLQLAVPKCELLENSCLFFSSVHRRFWRLSYIIPPSCTIFLGGRGWYNHYFKLRKQRLGDFKWFSSSHSYS